MNNQGAILITGGTSGIGLETVKQFASHGFHVQTCARNEFDFATVIDPVYSNKINCCYFDIADTQKLIRWIEQAGSRFGSINVLVNNAAAVFRKPLLEFTSQEFQQCLDVNLTAVLEASKAALPLFDEQSGGMVVNLSSMAAVDPFEGFSVYGACKAFIELFTKAFAAEVSDRNVRCFAVRAGTVETPLLRRVLPDFPQCETMSASTIAKLIFALYKNKLPYQSGDAVEITSENSDYIFR